MTETVYFDTDCLSAFLWVNNQSLLAQLYPGRIVLPKEVYIELSNPGIHHLKARVDAMIISKDAVVAELQANTEEYQLYRKMVSRPDPGHLIIGRGEASAIALAKVRGGVVASNNLRDVKTYVEEFGLELITTGDILKEALNRSLITEAEGNSLWQKMLRKRRRLGFASFSEYLRNSG